MNNTELFERILGEVMLELARGVYPKTYQTRLKSPVTRLPTTFWRRCYFLAMQELSEFYRWAMSNDWMYYDLASAYYQTDGSVRMNFHTELELFDIWKAEKGGEG